MGLFFTLNTKLIINLIQAVLMYTFFVHFGDLLENVKEIQDGWECIVELVANFVK